MTLTWKWEDEEGWETGREDKGWKKKKRKKKREIEKEGTNEEEEKKKKGEMVLGDFYFSDLRNWKTKKKKKKTFVSKNVMERERILILKSMFYFWCVLLCFFKGRHTQKWVMAV